MWFNRDFNVKTPGSLPIKVLRGPRQVGKTSLLVKASGFELVSLDDPSLRRIIQEDPRTFLDQKASKLILDEAPLAPALFGELKRRIDEERRTGSIKSDFWLTGSNQTLMKKNVGESLAGRASFFDLNTLSVHEIGSFNLQEQCLRGGWPDLRAHNELDPVRYLNDLISSFVERDIAMAAGIEKLSAFQLVLQLNAGRTGQLYVASEVSRLASIDLTTVQSWNLLLQQNGLIDLLQPFSNNANKRLIKSPKLFFHDVSFAVRLQGWTDFSPLYVSPQMGHLFENIVYTEIHRSIINRSKTAKIYHLRSKEKVEVDFLVALPNQKYLAIEAKMNPRPFNKEQYALLKSLKLPIVDHVVVSLRSDIPIPDATHIGIDGLWETLGKYL